MRKKKKEKKGNLFLLFAGSGGELCSGNAW